MKTEKYLRVFNEGSDSDYTDFYCGDTGLIVVFSEFDREKNERTEDEIFTMDRKGVEDLCDFLNYALAKSNAEHNRRE